MRPVNLLQSWGKILRGNAPLLSIEITRECPLSCPGCYAYGDSHLGPGGRLEDVTDLRGDQLVDGIMGLVEKHDPVHVSLVGGEPLVRHRELSRVLPLLSARGIHTMVVTSAVIPIPPQWMALPRVTVAVSVDGLPRDHDPRRKPATYEKSLNNIAAGPVNVHWTIMRSHVEQPGYMDEYLAFWSARPEVKHVWLSVYTPQRGEDTPEMLTPQNRRDLTGQIPVFSKRYPKTQLPAGIASAYLDPPASPADCIFSRMSVNYTADFETRVEPCIFGGDPDCSQCGCSISAALHWIGGVAVGPVKVRSLVTGSMAVGAVVNKMLPQQARIVRWEGRTNGPPNSGLIQLK